MHRYFICTPAEIDKRLESLTKTGVSNDEWTELFQDDLTKEKWEIVYYESEIQGGGVRVLKRLPDLTLDELISIALNATNIEDALGVSFELSFRERDNNEDFREKLITQLAKIDVAQLNDFEKDKVCTIIYESDLYDATNRRPIVGKHYSEIESDAAYYLSIAEKAKEILKNIEKYRS